jgi:hypothetical protein
LAARSECECERKWRKVKAIDSAGSDQFGEISSPRKHAGCLPITGTNLIEDALWLIPPVEHRFNGIFYSSKTAPNRSFLSVSGRIRLHNQLYDFIIVQLSAAKRMLIVVIQNLREPLLVLARLDLSDNKTDTAAESVNRALHLEPRTARLSPSSVLSQPSSRRKRSRCPTHEPASRNMRIDSAAQEPTSETGRFVKARLLVLNRPAITRVQHGFGGSSQDHGERYHPTHHR